jgi:hypothetical protein
MCDLASLGSPEVTRRNILQTTLDRQNCAPTATLSVS